MLPCMDLRLYEFFCVAIVILGLDSFFPAINSEQIRTDVKVIKVNMDM